jgi:hypothetical protein
MIFGLQYFICWIHVTCAVSLNPIALIALKMLEELKLQHY